jgi:hypothetical protein
MHCVATAGAAPAGTLVQVPAAVPSAHDWQRPVQALEQQTPCWQKVDAHSPPAPQVVPSALRPQVPVVVLHRLGETQSAVVVQVVLHWPFVPQLRLPPQVVGVTAAPQTPRPLHRRGGVKLAVVQAEGAHCVPLTNLRHAPAPSQVPSVPQVDAAVAVHWVATTGAVPAGTGAQVPTLPISAHDWQVPVHAELQQTFCTQKPEPQSAAAAQVAPIGFFPQLPLVQTFGATQSAFEVQVVLQAAVPHMNGEHIAVVAVRQAPAPSQVRAGVSVDTAQEAAPQFVPAG